MGQEILQFCLGVGNPLRETGVIQLVQRGQVALVHKLRSWITTEQL